MSDAKYSPGMGAPPELDEAKWATLRSTDDATRLKHMHTALNVIAREAHEDDKHQLEWEAGRLFVLEQIRQMRNVFEHYERRAEKAIL